MAISTAITSTSPPPPLFSTSRHHSPPPSSSFKFILTNEAASIAAAVAAVELATAALQAAREAALFTYEENWLDREIGNGDLVGRRKKRRKRRKGFEMNPQIKDAQLSRPVNGGFLTPIQEAHLCQCLKDETRLEGSRRSLDEGEEQQSSSSVNMIMHKGRISRAVMIHNYHRLVVSLAHTYRGKGLSIQDLIQEGRIGLLRGAEKYDPNRGTKLSTYVYWWIKEAIISSITKKSRIVRLPGCTQERIMKIVHARIVLCERLGRLPSHEEIAEMLNIHVSTVSRSLQMNRTPLSLDRNVGDEGSMTLQEIMAGPDEVEPEKMLMKKQMKSEVEKLLGTISEREAQILRLRFGLNGQTPLSYEEIGRSMKLTKERIRQIKELALSNIRHRTSIDDLKCIYNP